MFVNKKAISLILRFYW